MMSCPWLWMYFGAFLMLMELVLPGFVLFFFGLAASTVGLLRFGLGEAFSPAWQLAAFSALSIVYLTVLRRYMKRIFTGKAVVAKEDFESEYRGRVGKVTTAIEPPKAGRVEIGDAEWDAVADSPIAAGEDVKVVSQNNLTMKVEVIK